MFPAQSWAAQSLEMLRHGTTLLWLWQEVFFFSIFLGDQEYWRFGPDFRRAKVFGDFHRTWRQKGLMGQMFWGSAREMTRYTQWELAQRLAISSLTKLFYRQQQDRISARENIRPRQTARLYDSLILVHLCVFSIWIGSCVIVFPHQGTKKKWYHSEQLWPVQLHRSFACGPALRRRHSPFDEVGTRQFVSACRRERGFCGLLKLVRK